MCTSKVSKPARAMTWLISTCEFTPCSRRMATAGRADLAAAMKGAATSSAALKLRCTCSPGSSGVPAVACSASALAELSRRRPMRQLTSSHCWCRACKGAAYCSLASRQTSITPRGLVLPMKCAWRDRPCARSVVMTSLRSAVRTCITTPSSSLNSAASVSSLRRSPTWPAQFFESPYSAQLSAMPSLSVIRMSTFRLTPRWPAKAISQTLAHRPPSLRSW